MPGGLAAADLLGDAAAVEPLFCRICDSLVQYESAAHTSCAHVFCRSCLDEWFASAGAASCPTCRAQLATDGALLCSQAAAASSRRARAALRSHRRPTFAGVAELRKASPLGWRLLGRVQCRCPLRSQARAGSPAPARSAEQPRSATPRQRLSGTTTSTRAGLHVDRGVQRAQHAPHLRADAPGAPPIAPPGASRLHGSQDTMRPAC